MAILLKSISDSDTTLMFSEDASFPSANGVIIIGTEIILYENNYAGTLYGLVRGARSTSAAAHTEGAVISIQDFWHAEEGGAASFTNVTVTGLTASRAVATDASKVLVSSATTAAELAFVNGVTSAIQTQLNAKAPLASPTFSGTITTPLTASRAVVTGASSELAASATTAAEIAFVSGVTSAIQTQLNAKQPTISAVVSAATAGGGASESVTVAGLLTTSIIYSVSMKSAGANAGEVVNGFSNLVNGQIALTFTADPGAGLTVLVAFRP